ncbi:MAG TPA: dienelactone hydrolase family protein [Streptosporangiaceae bacterium]|nr:dienelactone hydrolase family protein [Streptosporangiaceae bacterium]
MPDINFSVGAADVRGYEARPAAGDGPWPGVVVLHEAFGLTPDIREQADRFAAAGYLALAPDLYTGEAGLRCVRKAFRDLLSRRGRTWETIEETRAWLAGRPECTGRVGVIGFCMGGGFALVAAAKYEFAAASVNYGYVPRRAAEVLAGACPIVASYGKRDLMLRRAAPKLERVLADLDVPHDVKEYPDVGHGFLGKHEPPLPVFMLSKIMMSYGHDAVAAEDAWTRILGFFGDHLGAAAGPKA